MSSLPDLYYCTIEEEGKSRSEKNVTPGLMTVFLVASLRLAGGFGKPGLTPREPVAEKLRGSVPLLRRVQ